MKRSLIGASIAAAVLMILFAACSEEPQIIAFERAEPVGSVSATRTDTMGGIIISWMPAKNAVSYDVYAQMKNNVMNKDVDMKLLGSSDTGVLFQDFNSINIYGSEKIQNDGSILVSGFSCRFGVVARDYDSNHATSDIVWSDYITIPDYTKSK